MRHRKKKRKFHRKKDLRKAFLKSLIVALAARKKIKTTEARAKILRSKIEKLITSAKKPNLSSFRYLERLAPTESIKQLKELALLYKERRGGYTRITKIGKRAGDRAKMVIIELI